MNIAVLIPCFNEEFTVKKVVSDFKREIPEAKIYVYDNNSTDNTYQEAKNAGAIVKKEFKQGKANVALKMFREIDADYYVMIDGDDTYPAEYVMDMIRLAEEKNADMVVGDRLSNTSYKNENTRNFHNFGNNLVKRLINHFFQANIKDVLTGYRVFSKRFVKNYVSTIKGFELEIDLTLYCLNYNFNIEQIPINYRNRPDGSTSKLNTFSDGYKVIKLFFNMYRLYKPLNFFSFLSSILFVTGIVLGIFPIREYLYNADHYVHKVPTAIMAISLIIISFLLFCCGLILDNLAKIDIRIFKQNLLRYDNENTKH
ncbi:MAG: glycosyltransferase family 2 protein [Flavobacteriaceae bacterium]|jgi:glycosyltransferase involved in cell wall biosynthesis|nr:glycosyltransferase family 2 protein [Flavobacteriaceae bacterium]